MRRARGRYRGLYLMPHGRGFKYLRAVPKDLWAVEGRTAWVKCLGAVSRPQAEILAHQLAALHGQRIEELRARLGAGTFRSDAMPTACDGGLRFQPIKLLWKSPSPLTTLGSNGQEVHRPAIRGSCLVPARTERLGDLVTLWLRVTAPRSRKTIAKTRRAVSRFIHSVGDLPVLEITKADLITFRNNLSSQNGLNLNTVSEHLSKISMLFKLAMREGIVEGNPADGLSSFKTVAKLSDRRQPFTTEQVALIFSHLSGEPEYFRWIVRLLAFHGMRSGEVCQLTCEDVTALHGVPVIRVHDKYGSVKNQASIRDIPLHPACTELLDFAKQHHAALTRPPYLFAAMPGRAGRPDWFQHYGSRFLRHKVGIADRRYTMHSFRHLWRTLARECEMPESVSRAIMGHKLGSGEHGAYGGAPSVKLRAEWIAKIDPLVG